MLLRQGFGLAEAATRVEEAVRRVLAEGLRTADIREPGCTVVGTVAMGDAVLAALRA
jgi:3-isopropylmalate dehydrogenase